MKIVITWCFVMATVLSVLAQRKNSLVVLAAPKPGGVWLRWAPVSAAVWQMGNLHGYVVERFTLRADGEMELDSKRQLSAEPVRPLSSEQMEKLGEQLDETAVLHELLYADDFKTQPSANSLSSILAKGKELENRFGLALLMCDLSVETAKAAGLFWNDDTAQRGVRYAYRIKLAVSVQNVPVEPAVVVLTVAMPKPLPAMNDLKATFANRKVTLSWSTLPHKGIYTAYHVEKSTDGKKFNKLTDLPYVSMSEKQHTDMAYYVDSLAENRAPTYYRVNGISPFAETGPYSNIVHGEGHDDLTGLLIIREGKVIEKNRIRLAWEFPSELEKQIAGFRVSSANDPSGRFTEVVPKTIARQLREATEETGYYNTYYILRAVDSEGIEVARSFPYLVQIPDETPPAVPQGLTGSVSKSGVTELHWSANSDTDLLGYRIFRTNALHEEYVEMTRDILRQTSFSDSVNIHVLNKNIFYSVIAVDKNFNTSDYSPPLKLSRPDVVAPAKPVFMRTEIFKDSIALAWQNSVSDDVARCELSRVEKDERLTRVVRTWNPAAPLSAFKDVALTPGKTYAYKLIVYDSADNRAETTSREIFFEPGIRQAVTVEAEANREAKSITLHWKNPEPTARCMVYRKTNDQPLVLYKVVEGNEERYVDRNLQISNRYAYHIQVVLPSGIRSEISPEIAVKF